METDEYIKKFQEIYLEEFGEEISLEEAHDNFLSIVNLLRVILRPLPKQSQDCESLGSFAPPIDRLPQSGKLKKHNN